MELTVEQFLKNVVLKSRVEEAQNWLASIEKVSPNWDEYRKSPVTAEAVFCLASMFSWRICFFALNKCEIDSQRYCGILQHGHQFLRKMYEDAIKLGLNVELAKVDSIDQEIVSQNKERHQNVVEPSRRL